MKEKRNLYQQTSGVNNLVDYIKYNKNHLTYDLEKSNPTQFNSIQFNLVKQWREKKRKRQFQNYIYFPYFQDTFL